MNPGTRRLFLLLAGSALGALVFWLWRVDRDPAPAVVPSALTGTPSVSVEPVPAEQESVEPSREPAPVPLSAVEPTTDTGPAAVAPAEPQEASESWRAIQQMLADQEFLDACERPTEAATEKLKALVARADGAIQRELQEQVAARLEAGLYERIPGYLPGQEVKWPSDTSLYRSWVGNGTGDDGWVVLERVDHPELYALSDRMKRMKAELKARERTQ